MLYYFDMADQNQNMEVDEDIEEGIIPEEDFREAIAACRQEPQLDRFFRMAPHGAKLFIGLSFYSMHFGDKVDPLKYAECQAEIEPTLTANDLNYLIRFESDENTKAYLRKLLQERKDDSVEEEVVQPEPVDVPIAPPKRLTRRRRTPASESALPLDVKLPARLGKPRPTALPQKKTTPRPTPLAQKKKAAPLMDIPLQDEPPAKAVSLPKVDDLPEVDVPVRVTVRPKKAAVAFSPVVKIAAVLAFLLGGACVFYFLHR